MYLKIILSLFLIWGPVAAELPPEVTELKMRVEKKVSDENAKLIENLETLQKTYTQKEKFVEAGDVKTALGSLEKGEQPKLTPEAPREIRGLLSKHEAMIKRVDQVYLEQLEKLKTMIAKKGDYEGILEIEKILGQELLKQTEGEELCEVEVIQSIPFEPKELTPGRARLSGGLRPTFKKFEPELEGAFFMRVPWRSKPEFQITAQTSGNIFLMVHQKNDANLKMPKVMSKRLAEGDWLKTRNFYRVYLEKGQEIKFKGAEATFFAKKIMKKKR